MDKMKIEIWSDIACPYCYIGKRKLEKALAQFPHKDKVELVWHSYELNPELPKKALDKTFYQYFAETHNTTEAAIKEDHIELIKLAKEVGLDYNFDQLVVANTSDALRLIKLAKESGLATEAEEVLFKAYFVDSEDISDRSVLIELGVEVGLSQDQIIKMLDSDKYINDIKKDIEYSENELNLEYIPFYLFNNKHIVQGSIASEEYLKVLKKSYDEWEQNGVSNERGDIISGQSCSIDGVCS
ncbi:DsbA family protein [Dysgonomonas sp. ZJ709]|uniref:DsbA family oxidoreductase n=1 Tax=Dysgonomonas sp. ZJ709 TaxID=2709797 RepID=UPI0013EB94B1|nr:DsbA family oxidoreductase [Dysgonomonas sp. ZJ709]